MAGRVWARALAAAAGKSYWREADAGQVVRAWESSGQSLRAFAVSHGLNTARVSRWAKRLGKGRGGRRRPGRTGIAPLKLRFHPVELIGNATAPERTWIEVVLLDGRRLRVPSGFASEDLERVLEVVEERSRC
jgi:hypothetical protein